MNNYMYIYMYVYKYAHSIYEYNISHMFYSVT